MSNAAPQADAPSLPLATASADEYGRSLNATPRAEAFWFQTGTAPYRGFSQPFRDRDGRWWWRAKPQFAWPLDYFTPLSRPPRMPFGRCLFGRQYPVEREAADSLVHFNVIADLAGYDITRVDADKRRAVRKGLKGLEIVRLELRADARLLEEIREVWNSHVERTGWNKAFDERQFAEVWAPLADHAGTNLLGARDKASGALCAWVIGRIAAGTVWVDTIASHTERVDQRPNDTLIYTLLVNAARAPGVRHANYFLRSALEPLERFKRSLGFDSSGLPSRLIVNPLVGAALRRLKPGLWARLRGDWPGAPADPTSSEP